jgi:hypothetical protein
MREQAQTFSLNQYFQTQTTQAEPSNSDFYGIIQPSAIEAPRHKVGTGLNFHIPMLNTASSATLSGNIPVQPQLSKPLSFTMSTLRQQGKANVASIHSDSALQTHIANGCINGGKDSSADLMRLTALLEDTRAKLERAHIKLSASETSVCRANNALTGERATANARIAQMAREYTILKKSEEKLRRDLLNAIPTQSPIQSDENFKMSAEGAVNVEEHNRRLQVSLTDRESEITEANEQFKTLSISHNALKTSYEQVATELGIAVAKHEADMENLTKTMNVDMAAKINTTTAHMRAELEAKLESTEKRNSIAEQKLLSRLEKTQEECTILQHLAKKHETRARLAEEFVAATEISPTVNTVNSAVSTGANAQNNIEAIEKYNRMVEIHDKHKQTSEESPHCVRKQMRTAAIARACTDMHNAIILGKATPSKRIATADRDTGLGCSSQRDLRNECVIMKSKTYRTSSIPYLKEDTYGLQGVHPADTCTQSSESNTAAFAEKSRVDALIGATKDDLTKALKFQTLLHKFSAGVVSGISVDADGNSTACMSENMEELTNEA